MPRIENIDRKGFFLISPMVSAAMLGTAIIASIAIIGANRDIRKDLQRRLKADGYATEFGEYLRSQTFTELVSGPMAALPLCAEINQKTRDTNGAVYGPLHRDIAAEIPQNSFGGGFFAVRTYSAKIINIKTMNVRTELCGQALQSLLATPLALDEHLLFEIHVKWTGSNSVTKRSVLSVLSGQPNVTIPPGCVPDVAGGRLTFERLPNGTVPNAEPSWNAARDYMWLGTQYQATHGITFCRSTGADNTCDGDVAFARVGNRQTAFSYGGGNDTPNAASAAQVGTYFVATSDDDNERSRIIINYTNGVSAASGVLIDVDDNEDYDFYAYDVSDVQLDTFRISDGDPNTGPGNATPWAFNIPGNQIRKIVIRPSDSGFALDQFSATADCRAYWP